MILCAGGKQDITKIGIGIFGFETGCIFFKILKWHFYLKTFFHLSNGESSFLFIQNIHFLFRWKRRN